MDEAVLEDEEGGVGHYGDSSDGDDKSNNERVFVEDNNDVVDGVARVDEVAIRTDEAAMADAAVREDVAVVVQKHRNLSLY